MTVGDQVITLLDKREAAELLGVTARTVWTYIRRGALPAQMVGGRWWITEENMISFLRGKIADPEEGERLRQQETRKRHGLKQNQDEPKGDWENTDSILW